MAGLRIAVAGAGGRMGRMLIEAVLDAPDCTLAGAFDRSGSPGLGHDAAVFLGRSAGVRATDDVAEALAHAQVLIDFTRPEGTLNHLALCEARGVAAVIGTTGFSPAQLEQVRVHAERLPIVLAPNMSVGVQAVLRLLEAAAQSLSEGYDIEVIEAHHRHKVDAPSGTALKMGQVIAQAQNKRFDEWAVLSREGHTGERKPGSIGFATVRGGDIVGDHTVLFAGTGERIEISHKSTSRAPYAQGSLRAARFLATEGRTPGLYGMDDVLGTPRP